MNPLHSTNQHPKMSQSQVAIQKLQEKLTKQRAIRKNELKETSKGHEGLNPAERLQHMLMHSSTEDVESDEDVDSNMPTSYPSNESHAQAFRDRVEGVDSNMQTSYPLSEKVASHVQTLRNRIVSRHDSQNP